MLSKPKVLTIDFNNKDVVTFDAMASVAQVMNTIPIEEQHILLSKQQLTDKTLSSFSLIHDLPLDTTR